jgi:hypothetical protein
MRGYLYNGNVEDEEDRGDSSRHCVTVRWELASAKESLHRPFGVGGGGLEPGFAGRPRYVAESGGSPRAPRDWSTRVPQAWTAADLLGCAMVRGTAVLVP